ncbi:TonB-dependent receptor [Sphingomonas sp. KR1UV-12]|uniref:TonB-dependent receptor n=1 Tax=Sphingomonas aurea TaxID=3063994 RepID=A0ABT9EIK8_9SPHN|nr:TonB-dependent receptor [Sphingomonas sp. KR1UV-12]MDP1026734.1 TonB-dependent receptor [Sphingomonas sp. KR1UV-12]
MSDSSYSSMIVRDRRPLTALRAGASIAVLAALALSAPAFAQQTPVENTAADQTSIPATTGGAGQETTSAPSDNPTAQNTDGEIIVTGIRASLQGARDRKKNAEQVIDSITAQDIGALPDRSVSEALQRIPGVTLQRTNENRDPARLSAEGGGVFIRGLSFVRSELNGRDVFSANNGRGLSFEDVSSDLLAGVDVYKNPSAELVEGGIGGIVNLRTRKPFDATGYVFAFSGDSNYADLRNKGFLSGNVLGSGRWQTGLGEVGLLLSYSIGNIGNRTDSITAGRYDRATLTSAQDGVAAGSTVYVPAGMGFRRIDWQQRRTAFDGSFQWKPSDTLLITAEALLAKATPKDIEYAVGDYDTPSPNGNSTLMFGDQNQLESGVLPNRNINFDTRSGKQTKKTQDYSLNLRWTPDEHWAFGADVQYVKSTAKVYSMTAFTQVGTPTTIAFDFSGDDPSINLSPTAAGGSLTNKSLYWWAAAMDHIEDNEADEWAQRADVEYTFTDSDFLKSFRVGGRATDRNAITRQTGYNWALLSAQYWGGGTPVTLDQTGFAGGLQNPGLPAQSGFFGYNNFFRGKVPSVGPGFWFPTASLVENGTANAYSYLKSTQSAGWGWTPLSDDYSLAAPAGDNVSGGINNQTEKTYAGYGLLRFGMDQGIAGHFDGNIGVRVIRTENSAAGSALRVGTITNPNCAVGVGGATAADCALLAQAVAFAGGNIGSQQQSSSGNYTDVLPSINLRFFLQDNVQLRFAAAKAMVRPTFAQLNPFTQLGFSFDANGVANGVGVGGRRTAFTGTSGNPNLKPTKADQFDTSLEWYFGRSNSLTFAGFYKRLRDYIFAGVTQQSFTSNGQTVTFDLTQQTNGSKGTIKGFEVGYTQFFDMLPGALGGLGFTGNFTYVDSSGGKNTAVNVFDANQTTNAAKELPLEGLSKYSFNIAGIYEKYGISARAAYNWRSTYLLTTSAANLNFPVWSENFGQLDASILYSIDKHFKIGVQGTNLLNSRTFLDVGDPDLKPRYSWTDTDRRIAILVRGVF